MNSNAVRIRHRGFFILTAVLALLLIQSACAATVYAGGSIDLSGRASGSDYVYLFITGPNLPSGGVSLENVHQPTISGDPSTFLRLPAKNNRWSYKWDTSNTGGSLDYGNYVIYVVNKPRNLHDLSQAEYSYIPVQILRPTVTAYTQTGDSDKSLVVTTSLNNNQDTNVQTQTPSLTPTPIPAQTVSPAASSENPSGDTQSPQVIADSENSGSGNDSSQYLIWVIAFAAVIIAALGLIYAYRRYADKKKYQYRW